MNKMISQMMSLKALVPFSILSSSLCKPYFDLKKKKNFEYILTAIIDQMITSSTVLHFSLWS